MEHYYTQIHKNALERGMLHPSASQQALFILAGLALQAELGDTYETQYYTKPHNYLPQQVRHFHVSIFIYIFLKIADESSTMRIDNKSVLIFSHGLKCIFLKYDIYFSWWSLVEKAGFHRLWPHFTERTAA